MSVRRSGSTVRRGSRLTMPTIPHMVAGPTPGGFSLRGFGHSPDALRPVHPVEMRRGPHAGAARPGERPPLGSGRVRHWLRNAHRVPGVLAARRRARDWRRLTLRYLGMSRGPFPYEPELRDGVRFRFESREEIKVFWNIFIRSSYHVDR